MNASQGVKPSKKKNNSKKLRILTFLIVAFMVSLVSLFIQINQLSFSSPRSKALHSRKFHPTQRHFNYVKSIPKQEEQHSSTRETKDYDERNTNCAPEFSSSNGWDCVGGIMFFVHVPKTGGTSLALHLQQSVSSVLPQVKYVFAQNKGVFMKQIRHRINYDILQYEDSRGRRGMRRKRMAFNIPPGRSFVSTSNSTSTQATQNRQSKHPNIYVMEIHVNDSPSLLSLNATLERWRRDLTAKGIPFFSFTVLRDPLHWTISAYNYYCVQKSFRNVIGANICQPRRNQAHQLKGETFNETRRAEVSFKMLSVTSPNVTYKHQISNGIEKKVAPILQQFSSNQQCLFLARGWKHSSPPSVKVNFHNDFNARIIEKNNGEIYRNGDSDRLSNRRRALKNRPGDKHFNETREAQHLPPVSKQEVESVIDVMERHLDWVGTTDKMNDTIRKISHVLQSWLLGRDGINDNVTDATERSWLPEQDDDPFSMLVQSVLCNFTSSAATIYHNRAAEIVASPYKGTYKPTMSSTHSSLYSSLPGEAAYFDDAYTAMKFSRPSDSSISQAEALSINSLSKFLQSQIQKWNANDYDLYRYFSKSRHRISDITSCATAQDELAHQ